MMPKHSRIHKSDDVEHAETWQSAAAIRESEQRWRLVFDQQFQLMALLDRSGVLIEVNELALSIAGIRREEVVGKFFWDTPWWKDLPEMRKAWPGRLKAAAGRTDPVLSEDVFQGADGATRVAEASVRAVRNSEGSVEFFIIQASDITERKRAEEALRESEQTLRAFYAFYENAPLLMGVVELTENDEIVHIYDNPATKKFFQTSQSTSGKEATDLGAPKQAVEEWVKAYQASAKANEPVRFEYSHRSLSGPRWISAVVAPVPSGRSRRRRFCYLGEDITERKQAEDGLRFSEERYRRLFESIDEGFCVIEVLMDENQYPIDYQFLEVNPAFEKQTGLANALGKRMKELAPQHEKHWFETYGKIAVTGQSVRFENRAEALGRWYDVYAFKVGAPEERKVALLFNDVTERKKIEESLRKTREQLQLAIEASDIGTWDWNVVKNEISWSERCKELFGIPRNKNVNYETFLEAVHPQDRALVDTKIHETLEQRKDYAVEMRINTADKVERWVFSRGRASYDANGRALRMSGTAMDITDRIRTQREIQYQSDLFHGVAAKAAECIFVTDKQDRVTYANPEAEKTFGFSCEELMGQPLHDMVHHKRMDGSPYPAEECPLLGLYSTGMPVRDHEDVFFRKDGSAVHIVCSNVPLDVGDKQVGAVLVVRDVTQQKLNEKRLEEMQSALAATNRNLEKMVEERTAQLKETVSDLETFSYTVSHDLRSPLRAMQGFSHLVLEEHGHCLDETGRGYLNKIDSAARRMDALIQDVIAYNTVARADVPIEAVDLEKAIDEVIHQYSSINVPHASFEIRRPLHKVRGNPSGILQVFSNLLGNAVKFVEPGKTVRIQIWTELQNDTVRIWVEDNGIGIPAELFSRIFEPFQRVHPRAGYEGTGIGLAIVKKAIEKMGGKIGVESEVGKGTRFWMELPAAL